ncbi:MAG: antitoxin [Actinomycetota bacterium]
MGLGDFVNKAKGMVAGNKDKAKEGIDKAADVADEKTGGKYSGQVDQGADAAKDAVENLDNE